MRIRGYATGDLAGRFYTSLLCRVQSVCEHANVCFEGHYRHADTQPKDSENACKYAHPGCVAAKANL